MSVDEAVSHGGLREQFGVCAHEIGDWLKAEQAVCDVLGWRPTTRRPCIEREDRFAPVEVGRGRRRDRQSSYTPRHRPSPAGIGSQNAAGEVQGAEEADEPEHGRRAFRGRRGG